MARSRRAADAEVDAVRCVHWSYREVRSVRVDDIDHHAGTICQVHQTGWGAERMRKEHHGFSAGNGLQTLDRRREIADRIGWITASVVIKRLAAYQRNRNHHTALRHLRSCNGPFAESG